MPVMETWMTSPFVEVGTDYEETVDMQVDMKSVAWFDVKFSLPETDIEKKERTEAIRFQIQKGILDQNGIPHGVQISPEMKQQLQQRQLDRQKKMPHVNVIDKPIIREVNGKKQVQLSPFAKQIENQLRRNRRRN